MTSHHNVGESTADMWSNWSGSVRFQPANLASPRTVDELVSVVKNAPGRIRPVGSGHSFTELATTSGTLLTLDKIDGAVIDVDTSSNHARLNAGASLNSLSRALQTEGLAFKNLGDIDVQSLAGAISTATHGTGQGFGCISKEIVAATLLTADADLLTISPTENAELLPAVQVAQGVLGVLVDATVALQPAYSLHRKTSFVKLADVLNSAMERWTTHRNFEFFVIPFCDHALTITHDETTDAPHQMGSDDSDGSLRDLRRLRTALGRFEPIRRTILNQVAKRTGTEDVVGKSWELLANERNTRFNEMEYHIPCEHGLDALAAVVQATEKNRDIYFPIECRWIAADDAWLSPFQGGDRISIAVHTDARDGHQFLFETIEPILRKFGGRPHWGKLHSLKAADVRDLYPDVGRFAEVRRQLDPGGRFLNPHLAGLFEVPFDG